MYHQGGIVALGRALVTGATNLRVKNDEVLPLIEDDSVWQDLDGVVLAKIF